MSTPLWLIPVLPLAGFLANGLLKLPRTLAALVGCAGPVASLVLSTAAFFEMQPKQGIRMLHQEVFPWITVGDWTVPFGLRVDELGAVMLLVVTGIGSLIHVYSIAYMRDDPGFSRFFAYLNLFMFSMLVLVMGDSIALMFVGWEGVGLCSYLLIGFWYKDLKNADAGKKAFITNRIGDVGFILGIFCLWQMFGTLDFQKMAETPPLNPGWGMAAALLLFLGACGKSAQIPLYVWLPDAMAGPTPVSALIHAATMVTAGVYMVGRMHFLYLAVPGALHVVAIVAAATALLAGVIAVAQTDIKKVLAYSTVSQLGFMFAGLASTDFTAGLFHVVTHAFFKALLFLGAGAVIHALHGEQDIRKMGGLARKLPALAIVFLAGGVALAGLPFSSGFYSKDQILTAAYVHEPAVYFMLALTALLTAFYTTRLCVIVFFGKAHEHGPGEHRELHRPGILMMAPLAILAVLSLFGGWLLDKPLHSWLGRVWSSEKAIGENVALLASADPALQARAQDELVRIGEAVIPRLPLNPEGEMRTRVEFVRARIGEHHQAHALNLGISSILFLLGAGAALLVYGGSRGWVGRLVEGPMKGVHRIVSNKFYVDEIYEVLVLAPVKVGATVLWFLVDRVLIDTILVNGAGRLVYALGWVARRPHTGSINVALVSFTAGVLAILAYLSVRFEVWKTIIPS